MRFPSFSSSSLRMPVLLALLCLSAGASFAVTSQETLRIQYNRTFTGQCCYSWGEAVQVTEPSKTLPVIITWSADYVNSSPDHFEVGLEVNGGPCHTGWGARELTNSFSANFNSVAFQWAVFPSDGLKPGLNTFLLCGGSYSAGSDSILIGYNALSARMAKVSPAQIDRELSVQTYTGQCCFAWHESVQVTEPASPVPVVVTWSADTATPTDVISAGVSVNGGPCLAYWQFSPVDGNYQSSALEFLLYPKDGLVPGVNTLTVCGGGVGPTNSISVLFNTLAVRITN